MGSIPANFRDSSYWKITDTYYLEGFSVTILHILAFVPFVAFSLVRFGQAIRRHPLKKVLGILRNEAKAMSILLGSLLLGYVVMLLLPALKVITQYETFPATQKSLLLYTPNFVAILLVIGSVLGAYYLFKRVFAHPDDTTGDVEVRQSLHTAFLSFIIFLAFLKNSYLAVLLLLPPAYFWMWVRRYRDSADPASKRTTRAINVLLILGGALTFVTMAVVLSTIFYVGVVYWYLFLSAAYGLISAYAVVLFFMAITVMIRLIRNFVLD